MLATYTLGVEYYSRKPLYGGPTHEEIAKNSSIVRLERFLDEWENARVVQSYEEMEECWHNGTLVR